MTEAKHYTLGDRVQVAFHFRDPATGELMDPDTVKFKWKGPADSSATTWTYGADAQIVKDATGKYHANIDADTKGWWSWKAFSEGTGKAAKKGKFAVDADEI